MGCCDIGASLIFVGLLELIGLGAIIPLLAIIGDPTLVTELPVISTLYTYFPLITFDDFVVMLGLLIIGIQILAGFGKITATKLELAFLSRNEFWLSSTLMQKYLSQPYPWFFNNHSSKLSKRVLAEARRTVHGAMLPLIQIVSHTALSLVIFLTLIAIDYVVAMSISHWLGGVILLSPTFQNQNLVFKVSNQFN